MGQLFTYLYLQTEDKIEEQQGEYCIVLCFLSHRFDPAF